MRTTITGRLTLKGEVKTSAKGNKWCEIEVTVDGNYPTTYPISVMEKQIQYLDKVQVGGNVTIECYVNAKPYNGKHYVNLSAAMITATQVRQPEAPQQQAVTPTYSKEDMDNLPF